MIIPTKLNVGYQTRQDTYTGKLAYVVYTDSKGVLRKESSWRHWIDKSLPQDEFDNVPMNGFVLNKKVGDYRGSWDGRKSWVRVYDPRGFEFEIGVDNLIYILEYCSSIKGKGIEGELIYAWDKADLVLLPVGSPDYVGGVELTKAKDMKVSRKDVIPGRSFITKKLERLMYLGKCPKHVYDGGVAYNGTVLNEIHGVVKEGEYHVFENLEPKGEKDWGYNQYFFETGFTKLSSMISEDIATDYATRFERYMNSLCGSGLCRYEVKEKEAAYCRKFSYWDTFQCIMDYEGVPCLYYLSAAYKRNTSGLYNYSYGYNTRQSDALAAVIRSITLDGANVKFNTIKEQEFKIDHLSSLKQYNLVGYDKNDEKYTIL